MKGFLATATTAVLAASFAGPGFAQDQQAAAQPSYQELDDVTVYSAGGTRIGEIEEVLIDQQGNLAYVLEVEEGFLGLSDREVVVPADRLSYDAQNKRYGTDIADADFQNLQTWVD